jgi:hypothetical protein
VIRVDGRWQCAYCRTPLDIPDGSRPAREMVIATSGKKNERAIVIDGKEIHRCVIAPR